MRVYREAVPSASAGGVRGRPSGLVARPPRAHTQPVVVRAAAGAQAPTTDQRVADAVEAVLAQAPASRRASLADLQGPLEGLSQLGRELNLNRVYTERVPGCFIQELTTDQNAFTGDVTNMARFTFGQFGPPTAQVDLGFALRDVGRAETGLPDLYRGAYDGLQNGYILFTHFRLVDPDADASAPPLLGVQAAVAEYGLVDDNAANMSVAFRKLKLWPVPSVRGSAEGLARWLKILQPFNANMDASGTAEVTLPAKGPVGMISYHLMANDLQMHVGNAGSHIILRRYTPPPGTLGAQLTA